MAVDSLFSFLDWEALWSVVCGPSSVKYAFFPISTICLCIISFSNISASTKSAAFKSFINKLSVVLSSISLNVKSETPSVSSSIFSLMNSQSSIQTTVFSGRNSNKETFSPVSNCVSTFGIIFTCNNFLSLNCVSGSNMRMLSTSFPNNSMR